MAIILTSPMGTEKIGPENRASVVYCIPPKKVQDARGTESFRLVARRPRPFCINGQELLPCYWGEQLRFLVCDAVKCDVGCIARSKPNGYRSTRVIVRHNAPEAGLTNLFCEPKFELAPQHAWATALETYDAMSRNALKFGNKSEKGKRLFASISMPLLLKKVPAGFRNTCVLE